MNHGELTPAPTATPIVKRDPHRPWTDDDVGYAFANNATLSAREIAQRLGRTHKAVKHLFARRGVRKARVKGRPRRTSAALKNSRAGLRWSEEELAALEAGDLTKLYRTRGKWAVVSQAKRIGSPLRSGDGFLSSRQVALQYNVRSNTVCEWIARGHLPAKRAGAMWRIDPAVASRVVPILKRHTRANRGRRGWWNA